MEFQKKSVVRINSRLYFDLFSKGGDRLIAFYCILKSARKKESIYKAYKSKNNKLVGGKGLIRKKTNLTLSSIDNYLPILIKMGLVTVEKNGDVSILGNQKTKELYSCYKIVPIPLGKNIVKTAVLAIGVRVSSAERQQLKQIDEKNRRSELIRKTSNPTNLKDYKRGIKLKKKYPEGIVVEQLTVLSNEGYDSLKLGGKKTEKEVRRHSKGRGAYWKKVLKGSGVVVSRRRFESIKAMSYTEYLSLKKNAELSNIHTFYKGYLCIELISSFTFTGRN